VARPRGLAWRRGLLVALTLAANLAVIAALLWSTTERLHVVVTVEDGVVTGEVGGAVVQAQMRAHTAGQVGLFLQGADPQAPIYWSKSTPTSDSSVVATQLYRLGTESAWANLRVTDQSTGQILYDEARASQFSPATVAPVFGDWFQHPLGGTASATPGLLRVGSPDWHSYRVEADLLRPRTAAGIVVLAPDGLNGLMFYFRPENRDVVWYDVHDGLWNDAIAAAPYRAFSLDATSSVQDVLRLILGGYPGALLFVLLVVALIAVERRIRRARSGTPVDVSDEARPGLFRPIAAGAGAVLLAMAGFALLLYVADALEQRMPHVQDSVAYLFQAKTFALGRLWVPAPAHPDFFKHEFIVLEHAGRWFSKYPPGWPALLALGVLAGAAWVVSPICGALCLLLLYLIGRDLFRPRVGLIAAAFGLTAPFLIFLSASMMAHASGLLFTLLMVWCFIRASRSARPLGWAIATGFAFGVLFLIRPYSAILVAVPLVVYALVDVARRPLPGLRRYVPALVATLPFVAAFLAYNYVITGDWFYPPQQLWWAFDQVGFGPQSGPFGFYPVDGLNNTSRNLTELLSHGFGWPQFLTLSLALVPFITGRARAWDWLLLLGFLSIIAGYAAWWADGIMYGARFYYEGFGYLILLTARGVDVALDLARNRRAVSGSEPSAAFHPRLILAPAAVGLVVLGLIGFNLQFYLPGQWSLYHGYNYVSHAKLDAVEAADLHHAVVFTNTGLWYEWWEYGEVFSANDPLLSGDVVFARDLGDAADQQLVADFPGRSFYRLAGTSVSPMPWSTSLASASTNDGCGQADVRCRGR
jgi:Dolichyl-phosphate-mannose-protein mannosyltransferase